MPTLISIIESPVHPKFSALYRRLGIEETKLDSIRKAIKATKKQPVDFIVAEFHYGFANNYAGVNVSNLDVLLSSLERYSPDTKTIVLIMKSDIENVKKLEALFNIHTTLPIGCSEQHIQVALEAP